MSILPRPAVVPADASPRPAPPVQSDGVADRVKEYARRADGESRAFVRRQPLVAVGAAAAAGALLGWLVKR